MRFLALMAMTVLLLPACSDDDNSSSSGSGETASAGDDVLAGVSSAGDVATFSVDFNTASLDETYTVDTDDDDYIENTTFVDTIYVQYGTAGASVTGDIDGLVSISGNDVVVNNTTGTVHLYVLSGTASDGFFKLYSSKKQGIVLNGLNLTNPDGAAINNQSKKRTFIVLADGTENYLVDGTSYADATSDEDMKACFFSEGQLIFSGKGSLNVDGNCKAGVRSDDYVRFLPGCNIYVDASKGNGIRGNDSVVISGGVLNVNITGTACKGISTDGVVRIDGGRTTVLTSGTYEWDDDDEDYSACGGIKADSLVTINAGQILLKSTGTGGKGIKSDGNVCINGGTVKIVTTGKRYPDNDKADNHTSPKGIKADGNLLIKGGIVQVRSTYSEGLEAKQEFWMDGGLVEVYAGDDAINSKLDMTINGGYLYAHSTGNDGLDANQNVYLNGGVVIAEGASAPEVGIDAYEGKYVYVNGGTIVALGGSVGQTASSSSQASVTATVSAGRTIALLNGNTTILGYRVPTGNGNALMISSPALTVGKQYTLLNNATLSGGTTFYTLTTGCTATAANSTSTTSLTAARQVGSGMGGGGIPGGGGGKPF